MALTPIQFSNTADNGYTLPLQLGTGPDNTTSRVWVYDKANNKWNIAAYPGANVDGKSPVVVNYDSTTGNIVTSIDLDTVSNTPPTVS
jgi:hypothetical protein